MIENLNKEHLNAGFYSFLYYIKFLYYINSCTSNNIFTIQSISYEREAQKSAHSYIEDITDQIRL